jgi:hypothetical protein
MAIPDFNFDPVTGWLNETEFPDFPTSAQTRPMFQRLFDQIKAHLGLVKTEVDEHMAEVTPKLTNLTNMFNIDITKKNHFIAGVVRYTSALGWYLQNDENHKPIGISSVSVVGGKVRIVYDFTATKVNTLIITPDDILAKKGFLVAGSGVGLTATDFQYSRLVDIYGRIYYNGAEFAFDAGTTAEYGMILEVSAAGVIKINHPNDNTGVLPVLVSGYADSHNPQIRYISDTAFEIMWFDKDTGAHITTFDDKCRAWFKKGAYLIPNAVDGYQYEDGNFFVFGIMEE